MTGLVLINVVSRLLPAMMTVRCCHTIVMTRDPELLSCAGARQKESPTVSLVKSDASRETGPVLFTTILGRLSNFDSKSPTFHGLCNRVRGVVDHWAIARNKTEHNSRFDFFFKGYRTLKCGGTE